MTEGKEVLLEQQDPLQEQNESAPYFLRDLIIAGTPTFGEEGWRRRRKSSRQECQKSEFPTSTTCLDDKTTMAQLIRKESKTIASKAVNPEDFSSKLSSQKWIFTKNGSFSSCSSSSCSTKFSEHKLIESNTSENQLSLKDERTYSGKEDQIKDGQKKKKKREIILASLDVDVGFNNYQNHQQQQQQQNMMLASFSPSNSPISRFLSPKDTELSTDNQDYYLQFNPQNTPRARSIPLINQWSEHPKISKRSPLFDKFGDRPERGICNVSAGAGVHTQRDNWNNRKQSTKTAGCGVNNEIQDISQTEGGYQDHLQVLLSARWASERKGPQTNKKSRESQNLELQNNQWTYEQQDNTNKNVETATSRQHLRGRSNTLGMVIPTLRDVSSNGSKINIWEGSNTKPNQQQKKSQQPPCPFLKASSPIKKNRHYLFESTNATQMDNIHDQELTNCNNENITHLKMNYPPRGLDNQQSNSKENNINVNSIVPPQHSKQRFCLSLLKKKETTLRQGQKLHSEEQNAGISVETTSCNNHNNHRNLRYNNNNNDSTNNLSNNITFSLPSFSPQALQQQHILPYPRILNHPNHLQEHHLSPQFLQETNNRQHTAMNTSISQDYTLKPCPPTRRNSLKLNNIILPISTKNQAPTQANIENLYDPTDNFHSHQPASKATTLICNKIKHVIKKQNDSIITEKYQATTKNIQVPFDKNNNINLYLQNINSPNDSQIPSRRCSFNIHQGTVLQSLTRTTATATARNTIIHNN